TGISVITTAPVTIRYLTLVHTLDGLALDALGTDIIIEHFHVNPTGTVSSRIGRGIRVKDSPSGSRVANSSVASLRGFGIRFDHVFNGVIEDNQVVLIDSMMGVGGGSGIKVFGGSDNQVRQNTIARTEGPEIFLDSTGTTLVTGNLLAGR